MLHDPARHEPLRPLPWDEAAARRAIQAIVDDTEARFSPTGWWPPHPQDGSSGGPARPLFPLYFGACGVVWALQHLQAVGAASSQRADAPEAAALQPLVHGWLADAGSSDFGSWLMGDTPALMLQYALAPDDATADRIEALIAGNTDNPARELMWGAPGTMLAALFMHRHTGQPRWADLFRSNAGTLWSQLLWSDDRQCHYWTQDLYGSCSTYIDAVHGFVATASPLIQGRHLLPAGDWQAWQQCIENTALRTAIREGDGANWPAFLTAPAGSTDKRLMQFCHGAPGFVVCLADMPGPALDTLLLAAGQAVWAAGPLAKGSNLCHGTGGNGYAFLKLYRRTGDALWLDRARAFAMHGIGQTAAAAAQHGQMRYSLWTGDPGFAIYLWDCVRGGADFPTLDVFFVDR